MRGSCNGVFTGRQNFTVWIKIYLYTKFWFQLHNTFSKLQILCLIVQREQRLFNTSRECICTLCIVTYSNIVSSTTFYSWKLFSQLLPKFQRQVTHLGNLSLTRRSLRNKWTAYIAHITLDIENQKS